MLFGEALHGNALTALSQDFSVSRCSEHGVIEPSLLNFTIWPPRLRPPDRLVGFSELGSNYSLNLPP
ncbi:hypothetical protein ES708_12016 [subsurface metagenome]